MLQKAGLILVLGSHGCTWQIHYDRPAVRRCEQLRQEALQQLKECQDSKPKPNAYIEWWDS